MNYIIHEGDVRAVLPTLEAGSVNTCVTSPPYWGLRDYGTAAWEGGDAACDHKVPAPGPTQNKGNNNKEGTPFVSVCGKCGAVRIDSQLGLESTPAEYVEKMVAVFREVRRVLRDDGTCWINLGSSYASANTRPTQSHRPSRGPACGSDGTEPQGSQSADRVCFDSCDALQGGKPTHPLGIVHSDQPTRPDACSPLPKGRDTERSGSSASPESASPLSVLESTTQRFSSQLADVSCQEAPASVCREEPRTNGRNSLESAGNSVCTSDTFQKPLPLVVRTVGKESFYSACHRSDCQGVGRCGYCWCSLSIPSLNIKSKDMVPIPWMVAMALQADGWYLRSDIIWHKPNPMPESVTDRPTKAHEYLFLLAKSAKCYYDADAIAEPCSTAPGDTQRMPPIGGVKKAGGDNPTYSGNTPEWGTTRNKRTVWTVATQPYAEAHFATYPEKLIEPCILAGCPVGGVVLDPFNGSGTTGAVAVKHGRNYVGIELNPAYIEMAKDRIGRALKPGTYQSQRPVEAPLFGVGT